MERLRCLAHEALSWAWLTPQQRLVWAAAIELDAVPLQERFGTGEGGWPWKIKGSRLLKMKYHCMIDCRIVGVSLFPEA